MKRHCVREWPQAWLALAGLLTLGACGGEESTDTSRHEAMVLEHKRRRGHLEDRGRWRELPEAVVLDEEQAREIERLEAIGYASSTGEVRAYSGVTLHDPERAFDGLNLVTSGHDSEAQLTDMQGNVLHSWAYDYFDAFPDQDFREITPGIENWRRVALLDDGSLIAIHEGQGVVKLDRDSNLVWAVHNGAHHDLEILPDGRFWILTREAHMMPRIHPDLPVLEDSLTLMSPDGEELRRVSLIECLENAGIPLSEPGAPLPSGDVMHTNTLEVLDEVPEGLPAAFAPGRILTSFRYFDMIGVVDPRAKTVLWAAEGDFVMQHDPTLLSNGEIQLFDNLGVDGRSAITRLDPNTLDVTWRFRGSDEQPFYSKTCGTAQPLPNGNVLVSESDGGRAFELTPEHEIVWEFWNPHRAGENDRYIATLFEVVRLERSDVTWLE